VVSGFGPPPGPPEAPVHVRRASYLPPGGLGARPAASVAANRGRYALTRGAKPGIIPLAPLRLGDLLDGSVKHIRRNPGPVLGVSALANAFSVLPVLVLVTAAFAGSWLRATRVSTIMDAWAVGAALNLVGTIYATLVLTAVLSYAAAEAALGRRRRLGEIWAAVRSRIWTVLGSQALVVLAAALPWALLVGMLSIAGQDSVWVVLLVGLGFGLLAIAANAFVLPRLLYSGPAAVLEGLSLRRSFARSWSLSRGRAWSLVGVLCVVVGLAFIVYWVVELPQLGIYGLLTGFLEITGPAADSIGNFNFALANLGAAILVTPFVATSMALHYLDARIRKEGFDLALQRAATADMEARS